MIDQLYRLLGMAVFERIEQGQFRIVGELPDWWLRFEPETDLTSHFTAAGRHPFLDNFLIDAQQFWSSATPGRIESGIWQFSDADGAELLLEIHAFNNGSQHALALRNLSDADGRGPIQEGRGIKLEQLRDEARRNQLEIELQAARVSADQLTRAKSEFVATVSHEMRTPLTSILGIAELLKDTTLTESQLNGVLQLQESAQTLLGIVSNLLEVARIESGGISIQRCSFNIEELTDDLLSSFLRQPTSGISTSRFTPLTMFPRQS